EACRLETCPQGCAVSSVLCVPQQAYVRIGEGNLKDPLGRAVLAAIVDYENLIVQRDVLQGSVRLDECLLNAGRFIECGDDQRDGPATSPRIIHGSCPPLSDRGRREDPRMVPGCQAVWIKEVWQRTGRRRQLRGHSGLTSGLT